MNENNYKELILQSYSTMINESTSVKVLLMMKNKILRELEPLKEAHRRMYFNFSINRIPGYDMNQYEELSKYINKLSELLQQIYLRIDSISKNKTVLTLLSVNTDTIRYVFELILDKAEYNKYICNHWLNLIYDHQELFANMRQELLSIKTEIEEKVYEEALFNLEALVKLFDEMKIKLNQSS